jgi:hypothetical protein
LESCHSSLCSAAVDVRLLLHPLPAKIWPNKQATAPLPASQKLPTGQKNNIAQKRSGRIIQTHDINDAALSSSVI